MTTSARRTSAPERAAFQDSVAAFSLIAVTVLTIQKLLEDTTGVFRHLFEQAFAKFRGRALRVADRAGIGDLFLVRRPGPRHGLVEDGRTHGISVQIDFLRDQIAADQVRCNRQHH